MDVVLPLFSSVTTFFYVYVFECIRLQCLFRISRNPPGAWPGCDKVVGPQSGSAAPRGPGVCSPGKSLNLDSRKSQMPSLHFQVMFSVFQGCVSF